MIYVEILSFVPAVTGLMSWLYGLLLAALGINTFLPSCGHDTNAENEKH
jgi:hypothetical protein